MKGPLKAVESLPSAMPFSSKEIPECLRSLHSDPQQMCQHLANLIVKEMEMDHENRRATVTATELAALLLRKMFELLEKLVTGQHCHDFREQVNGLERLANA